MRDQPVHDAAFLMRVPKVEPLTTSRRRRRRRNSVGAERRVASARAPTPTPTRNARLPFVISDGGRLADVRMRNAPVSPRRNLSLHPTARDATRRDADSDASTFVSRLAIAFAHPLLQFCYVVSRSVLGIFTWVLENGKSDATPTAAPRRSLRQLSPSLFVSHFLQPPSLSVRRQTDTFGLALTRV